MVHNKHIQIILIYFYYLLLKVAPYLSILKIKYVILRACNSYITVIFDEECKYYNEIMLKYYDYYY